MRTYIIFSLLITLTSYVQAAEKAPEKKTKDASTQTDTPVQQPGVQPLTPEEAQKLLAALTRIEAKVEIEANKPCIIQ